MRREIRYMKKESILRDALFGGRQGMALSLHGGGSVSSDGPQSLRIVFCFLRMGVKRETVPCLPFVISRISRR